MQKYVVGFIFDPKIENILLIKKVKPDWQKDFYNGIGGKIEENETSLEAIMREVKEESNLNIKSWNLFSSITIETSSVDFYYTIYDYKDKYKSLTLEEVFEIPLYLININNQKLISNLTWLIPLALDKLTNTLDYDIKIY